MLYKFDILFKKELNDGGVKVVTYNQIIENPNIFGSCESLNNAVGTLSLTNSIKENNYSISTLFAKYRSQLVGHYWSEVFGKDFPLQLRLENDNDIYSIRAELRDENGYLYSSDVQTISVDGAQTLDLTGADTFVALVPKTGPCTVADAESELTLQPGQLVLVPAACKRVTMQGNCLVKSIKCVN